MSGSLSISRSKAFSKLASEPNNLFIAKCSPPAKRNFRE